MFVWHDMKTNRSIFHYHWVQSHLYPFPLHSPPLPLDSQEMIQSHGHTQHAFLSSSINNQHITMVTFFSGKDIWFQIISRYWSKRSSSIYKVKESVITNCRVCFLYCLWCYLFNKPWKTSYVFKQFQSSKTYSVESGIILLYLFKIFTYKCMNIGIIKLNLLQIKL